MPIEVFIALTSLAAGLIADKRESDKVRPFTNDGPGHEVPRLREDWVMPEAPVDGLVPFMYRSPNSHPTRPGCQEDWELTWIDDDNEVHGAQIPWPFMEDDIATEEDLEKLGFEAVY